MHMMRFISVLKTKLMKIQGVIAISGKRFKLKFDVFILIVLKQTIPQQKALDLSLILAP